MRKSGLVTGVVFAVVVFIFVVGVIVVWNFVSGITGNVVEDVDGWGGPSVEDVACLESCVSVGCEQGDEVCMGANSEGCEVECGVESKPVAVDEGEICMQECVGVGCGERDVQCIRRNLAGCEDECGMIGEPEAKNEEEQCIRDCIDEVDSSIECSHGTFEGEGETGNEVCQRCAKSCEYLYSGPCLNDEQWTAKENECYGQCEHCYGEAVMGPSGEGYECTVDIKCSDASGEFGDDAGTGDDSYEEGHEGPGIGDEGYVAPNIVLKVVDSVVGFFKGLFS